VIKTCLNALPLLLRHNRYDHSRCWADGASATIADPAGTWTVLCAGSRRLDVLRICVLAALAQSSWTAEMQTWTPCACSRFLMPIVVLPLFNKQHLVIAAALVALVVAKAVATTAIASHTIHFKNRLVTGCMQPYTSVLRLSLHTHRNVAALQTVWPALPGSPSSIYYIKAFHCSLFLGCVRSLFPTHHLACARLQETAQRPRQWAAQKKHQPKLSTIDRKRTGGSADCGGSFGPLHITRL